MYDVVILGAGPAGITAGIYAARKFMKLLMIAPTVGGQTLATGAVENFTSYQIIDGVDLVKRFRDHLQKYHIEVREGDHATAVEKDGDIIRLTTAAGNVETKSLIIATGMKRRKLQVPGEDRLAGKGISYCATCDAPLFAGRDVAVAGGGNAGVDATLQLLKTANRVYLAESAAALRADPILAEKLRNQEKLVIFTDARITEIRGEATVTGIQLIHQGEPRSLDVTGVFVEVGWEPVTGFAPLVEKNRRGEILVNCYGETNIPGIFAAGDCTSIPGKQIVVACGEGAKAALAAFDYISRKTDFFAAEQPATE